MSQDWAQRKSYDGVYHDELLGMQYQTVLADWKCTRCGYTSIAVPDGIGSPSECDCKKMSDEELRKRKKSLSKGHPL